MNRKFILLCLAAVLVVGAVVGVAACGNTDPIVGTWVSDDGDTLVFNKDGTASYTSASGETNWSWTWEYTTRYSEDLPYTLFHENGVPSSNMRIEDDGTIRWNGAVFTKQ